MTDKQSRAETILATILELAATHSSVLPLPKRPGRLVRLEDWEARILPGRRWSIARGYQERVERRLIDDPEWRTIELRLKGREVLVLNFRSERVDVHFFRPGAWEERFGSCPGDDTVRQEPWDQPIGPHADEQTKLHDADLGLPARRDGPASGDDLRNPTMRQRPRSRAESNSTSRYSVALSGRPVPGS